MKCLRLRKDRRESSLLLFAAGETIEESALKTVPEYLQPAEGYQPDGHLQRKDQRTSAEA